MTIELTHNSEQTTTTVSKEELRKLFHPALSIFFLQNLHLHYLGVASPDTLLNNQEKKLNRIIRKLNEANEEQEFEQSPLVGLSPILTDFIYQKELSKKIQEVSDELADCTLELFMKHLTNEPFILSLIDKRLRTIIEDYGFPSIPNSLNRKWILIYNRNIYIANSYLFNKITGQLL